jgi:hypothetical protein
LGLRQPVEAIEHGRTELVQPVVGQLHLGLDAHGPGDVRPLRSVDDVRQERRLADAGLAAQHHDPGLIRGDVAQQPIEHLALGLAPEKPHPTPPPADRAAWANATAALLSDHAARARPGTPPGARPCPAAHAALVSQTLSTVA